MGKPRGKGPKPASNETSLDTPAEDLPTHKPGSPLRAVDGHNVDGWADEDIRTYNELLTERAKLEKEKNELEQKSSRHHTQRALLDENATALDSLFKAHLGGDFKFTGSGKCCLDFDVACEEGFAKDDFPCKHEICLRAKTKGVSWMEMDTIKYYHARIVSEKSQRMQSALRKQRDVELVRVKKDDDEEAAIRTRRNAILDKATRGDHTPAPAGKVDKGRTLEMSALDMLPMASKDFLLDPKNSAILEAAKENEHIVRRIRGRLDKIRHDVNAGRVSPADARVKLDQANSEMAEAERKNNEFRQMILDAEPSLSQLHPNVPTTSTNTNTTTPGSLTAVLQNTLASSNADAFSQALTVMKGFFSASDPHDVQTAITDLRSVLEINGPMSPVLKKSFNALEDMLAKPNASAFSLNLRTSDGKITTCNNVVEVLLNLRLQNQGSDNPATIVDSDNNVDSETLKSNQECMKVENTAKKEMIKQAEKMAEDTDDHLKPALIKIKSKAVLKSPISALSDIVLDDMIADIMFRRSLKALVVEAETGASSAQHLSAKITGHIISNAQNKPDKFLTRLSSVKEFIRECKKEPPQVFLEAVAKVDDSMPKFVAARQEKLKKAAAASKPAVSIPKVAPLSKSSSSKPITVTETKYLLEGTLSNPSALEALFTGLELPFAKDVGKLRARIYEYYNGTLESGIWDLLHLVLNKQTSNKFFWIDFEKEKKLYAENLRLAAADPDSSLAETLQPFHEHGLCPGRAVIVIVQRITLRIRENFDLGLKKMEELGEFCRGLDLHNGGSEWLQCFSSMAARIPKLYYHLDSLEPGQDTNEYEIMVVDLLAFMSTFVLGSQDGNKAEVNMRHLEEFIVQIMLTVGRSGSFKALQIQQDCLEFASMAKGKYLCPPTHKCRGKCSSLMKDKLASVVPAPLNLTKKGELLPEDDPTTNSSETLYNYPIDMFMFAAVWERARTLTPHLNCMAARKNCICSRSDKEFSEEIQALKNSIDVDIGEVRTTVSGGEPFSVHTISRLLSNISLLRQRPATFAGNQQRVKELRATMGPTSFAEYYPELQIRTPSPSILAKNSTKAASETTSGISLKEVPVNLPSIQSNISSTASEKGNLEKDPTDVSPKKKTTVSGPTKPKTQAPPPPAEIRPPSPVDSEDSEDSTEPWPMTPRELELRNQLLKFTNSVDSLHSFASVPQPAVKVKHTALEGVTWQVEEMLIGHVEMAYLIAKEQNYHGLKAWMEFYYRNTMPTPLDDNFKVNGGKVSAGGSASGSGSGSGSALKVAEMRAQAAKAKEQSVERLRQLEQFAESLSPSAAAPASAAAVVEQAEKAVADVEQLGRDFIQQMQIVSGRKKRMPKRKR